MYASVFLGGSALLALTDDGVAEPHPTPTIPAMEHSGRYTPTLFQTNATQFPRNLVNHSKKFFKKFWTRKSPGLAGAKDVIHVKEG